MDKLFDVQNDELCFIVGTLFLDLPQKPNVLVDIADDPDRLSQLTLPSSYVSNDVQDGGVSVYLEDYSGRIQLDGDIVKQTLLVTGNI